MTNGQRAFRFQVFNPGRERVASGYRWATTRPSWVARAAALAFLVVVGLPILVLVIVALLAAAMVYGVLALADAALRGFRGQPRVESGRQNVRVIERKD